LRELSLHILDIAANSIAAGATRISIYVEENQIADRLIIRITDNGKGMSQEMIDKVTDPFVTSRTERNIGLGIPLLKEAAEACNGSLKISSEPGKGTAVEVQFQLSHIDRMPLGDLADTFLALEVGTPEVHWSFDVKKDDKEFSFDDEIFKRELGDLPLSHPDVIRYLRTTFTEGIDALQLI